MADRFSEEYLRETLLPLCGWFEKTEKPFPWRSPRSAYRVWVSEVMLQQTRTAAVIPYFERFVAELPNVRALASVPDDRLMKLWEGLGYYSRARNLKKAAEMLLRDFGGELPGTREELLTLPGIGEYTAGAIASIAFGKPEPAVDGNVLRVVARLCGMEDDVNADVTKKKVAAALRAIYPKDGTAGRLTEALMELGENICIPNGRPDCVNCPLAERCVALAAGRMTELPRKSPKKPRRVESRTVLLLISPDGVALSRRPERGLLAGLWEFPNFEGHLSPEEVKTCVRDYGVPVSAVEPLPAATHIFTHIEWHMIAYRVTLSEPPRGILCVPPAVLLRDYPLPTAFRVYRDIVGKME